jgi:hypothetical protein
VSAGRSGTRCTARASNAAHSGAQCDRGGGGKGGTPADTGSRETPRAPARGQASNQEALKRSRLHAHNLFLSETKKSQHFILPDEVVVTLSTAVDFSTKEVW